MGVTLEELDRAGLIVKGGSLVKKKYATDIRPAGGDARQTDLQPDGPGPVAVVERDSGDGALAAVQNEKGVGQGFLVVVTTVRKRLLDEDNLCEKYHVDLCRYAGAIPGDSPATTRIEVRQEKADPGQREEVRIEIFQLSQTTTQRKE